MGSSQRLWLGTLVQSQSSLIFLIHPCQKNRKDPVSVWGQTTHNTDMPKSWFQWFLIHPNPFFCCSQRSAVSCRTDRVRNLFVDQAAWEGIGSGTPQVFPGEINGRWRILNAEHIAKTSFRTYVYLIKDHMTYHINSYHIISYHIIYIGESWMV